MKIRVDGRVYDSSEVPIVIELVTDKERTDLIVELSREKPARIISAVPPHWDQDDNRKWIKHLEWLNASYGDTSR